ncbi:MAG: hypothetical protein Unbinned4512contig1001_5 [Prokaryotic dsDNA virus sp.]|nr:MAG: hypothetical protein Unbinned4512contig1001_5 [Prokaryotic dsDNA virus sp.]|tara:strand:- start:2574 stop:2780 length:207 start_codon:yes stop_codon:yes gene_type:complete
MEIKKVANDNYESLKDFLYDVDFKLEEYLVWLEKNHPESKEVIVTGNIIDTLHSLNFDAIYKVYENSN